MIGNEKIWILFLEKQFLYHSQSILYKYFNEIVFKIAKREFLSKWKFNIRDENCR